MPDLQNFDVSPLAGTVNMPRFAIECRITDSATGAVIADFTGANAIVFPNELTGWTAAERRQFVRIIARHLIRKRVQGTLEQG
jgi:hypothetical protein